MINDINKSLLSEIKATRNVGYESGATDDKKVAHNRRMTDRRYHQRRSNKDRFEIKNDKIKNDDWFAVLIIMLSVISIVIMSVTLLIKFD